MTDTDARRPTPLRQRGAPGPAGRAVPGLRSRRDDAAVATREGLMPVHPEPRAVPHLWRWADLLPLAARSADLVPVGRGGERRAISLGNPGPARRPVHHADPVGRDPVPGAPRGRPRTPAQPVGVPVRPAGRGGVDGRGRGPGRDAPRRPAADARLGVPRAPERVRHSRWRGWTAWTSRWSPRPTRDSSSSARTRYGHRATPERSYSERLWGAARPHPGRPGRDPPGVPADGLPLGAHRRGPRRPAGTGGRRDPRGARSRATPRSGTPTRPAAATR